MNERNAPRAYGLRVGLLSGLFSILQVGLSTAGAHGSEASLRSIQQAFAMIASGGVVDPFILIPALAPMLLVTYLSMAGAGLLTIWFAARAARLAALAQGRRAGGASAGMWTWLVGTGIWLIVSLIAATVTHSDGTLTGVFTGTFSDTHLPQQLILLLIQELIAALICLGFCALAGSLSARHVELVAPEPTPPPMRYPPMGFPPPGAYPVYPAYPYASYPAPGYMSYGGYPQQSGYPGGWASQAPTGGYSYPPQQPTPAMQPMPASYPPPPTFYVPQPPAPQADTAPTAQPE